MTRLEWNQPGTSLYEYGVDRGVFYPRNGPGVPWNGLVGVEESTEGAGHTPYYFDGIKYLDFMAAENYQATVEAYAIPSEFAACDGVSILSPGLYATQQRRERFNFSYRTLIANEFDENLAYKVHLVYNATAAPSPRTYSTLTNTAVAPTRTWTVHTIPFQTAEFIKPTAHLVIDSRDVTNPTLLQDLEDILYGSTGGPNPSMPTLETIKSVLG